MISFLYTLRYLKLMKIAFFDTHEFEKPYYSELNKKHPISFLPVRCNEKTAILAKDHDIVCCFVNDRLDAKTLQILKKLKIKFIALRSAGFNNVDLKSSKKLNLPVARVPAYSPHAVAEHTIALLLTLNRKIHRSYQRVRELNFSLDGLVGFDLNEKTVGIIGAGKIGSIVANILLGFGCNVLIYDQKKSSLIQKSSKIKYVTLEQIYNQSDIITLHCPLTTQTKHILNNKSIAKMKKGVLLINTGRGALIDTKSLIHFIKNKHIAGAALDVYEEEENVFFKDLSSTIIQDDQLARLLTFPNVIITSHQAFLTKEALQNIADTTYFNIDQFVKNQVLTNQV